MALLNINVFYLGKIKYFIILETQQVFSEVIRCYNANNFPVINTKIFILKYILFKKFQ